MKALIQSRAVWLLPPLLMGVLAVHADSLWIDEFITWSYTSQSTFAQWLHDLRTTGWAEAQMPMYLAYMWGWDKLCGHSEVSLRVASLPWFAAGTAVFLYAFQKLRWLGAAVVLVTVSSPFLWYYLNEARLYAMQFGVTCAIFAPLLVLHSNGSVPEREQRCWFQLLLIGVMAMAAISIIGMIWTAAVFVSAWIVLPRRSLRSVFSEHRWLSLGTVFFLGALAAYYLWTVLRGARATVTSGTNWQAYLFIPYELLGFSGLGPDRGLLRERGARALVAYWPGIVSYALAVGTVLGAGLISIWKSSSRGKALWILAALSFPALFLLAVGVVKHFRVLGRHCTPLMPVLLCVLALGVMSLWRRGWLARGVVMLFLGLSLTSALRLRWNEDYGKDDYRSAARFSSAALREGRQLWWSAAFEGAAYYGVPLTTASPEGGKAVGVFNASREQLAGLAPPDFIVVSKPDVYDASGALGAFIDSHPYELRTNYQAFAIWQRKR